MRTYIIISQQNTTNHKQKQEPKLLFNTPPKRRGWLKKVQRFRPVIISTPPRPQAKPCWCRWTRSPGATASCFDIVCYLMVAHSKASSAWIHQLSPDEGWIPFRASNSLGTYPAQAQYSFYVPPHGTFKFKISIRKNRRKGNVAVVFHVPIINTPPKPVARFGLSDRQFFDLSD